MLIFRIIEDLLKRLKTALLKIKTTIKSISYHLPNFCMKLKVFGFTLLFSLIGYQNIAQTADSFTFNIDENLAEGDTIGLIQVTNPQPATTYIYKLTNDSAVNATFNIDTLSGLITVKNNTWLDAEVVAQINFFYNAKSLGSGAFNSSNTITININDIPEPVFAGFGYALNYNNFNSYISGTYNQLPQGNAPRTLEAWVRTTSHNTMVVFNFGVTAFNQRSCMLMAGGNVAHIAEVNDTWGNIYVADGNWHHVAITFDGNILNQYIDGVLDYTHTNSFNTNGLDLNIGRRINQNGEWFDGDIDEVVVWNRALTQQEILQRQNQRPDVTDPNLVVYFPFEEATNTPNTIENKSNTNAPKFGFTQNSNIIGAPLGNVFFIDQSYTNIDTIGTAFASDPDGSTLTFNHLEGGISIFDIQSTTGKITIQPGVTLDTIAESSYFLTYEVIESGDATRDTGVIQIIVSDTILFTDTTVSIGQLYEKGREILMKRINMSSFNEFFTYEIISGNNHQIFDFDAETQSLFVNKPDSLLFAINPTRQIQIEATNTTTGKKQRAIVTLNILNSGAPVYAGFGNALFMPQNGDLGFEDNQALDEFTLAIWTDKLGFQLAGLRFDYFPNQLDFIQVNGYSANIGSAINNITQPVHFAVSKTIDNTLSFYLNGKLLKQERISNLYRSNFNHGFFPFTTYDDATVYRGVLSEQEIQQLMQGKINVNDTNLRFYFSANQQNASTTFNDNSQRNLTGERETNYFNEFATSFDLSLTFSENQNTTDTLFYLNGMQPNGLSIQYSAVSQNFQKFNINASTGAVTLKHPDSLQYPRDSSLTLIYQVTETTYGGVDTAQINIQVLPHFSIVADSISLNQNPLLGFEPLKVLLNNSLPLSTYQYQIKSGNPNNAFEIDSLGNLKVNNPSVLTNVLNPTIDLEIKVTEMPSGNTDSAIFRINVLNSPSEVYTGWGNYLKLADRNTLKFPASTITNTTPNRTISYWVEASEFGFFGLLLDGFSVYKHDFYWFHPSAGFGNILPYTVVLPENGPIHFACVVSPNKTEIYRNGILLGAIPYSEFHFSNDEPYKNNALIYGLGQFTGPTTNDYIAFDDLAVWDKALTVDEIQKVYKLGVNTSDPNLVRYYPMNQVDVNNLVLDYGGNNLNGQIIGEESENYFPYLDTFSVTLSKSDIHFPIGYAQAWEPINNNISYSLIGSQASNFQINADNSITLNPNNTFTNDTQNVVFSYVATDVNSNNSDTFSYNLTILPATEALDTTFDFATDAILGITLLENLIENKNPNILYNYQLVYATQLGIFSLNDTSGHITFTNRNEIYFPSIQQNILKVRITNQLGFVDTANITINYINKPNKIYAGFGKHYEYKQRTGQPDEGFYIKPEDFDINQKSFTLEFWVKNNNLGTETMVFRRGCCFNFLFGTDGKFIDPNSAITPPLGDSWHHIAMSIDLNNFVWHRYLNGQLLSSVGFGGIFGQELPSNWEFIDDIGGNYIDEVRFWHGVRTPEQIAENYYKPVDPNSDSLAIYFNFNQLEEDLVIGNLVDNEIVGYKINSASDIILVETDLFVLDSLRQSSPQNDTIGYAFGNAFHNTNTNLTFSKLGSTFDAFDLDATTGLVTLSPSGNLNNLGGNHTLEFIATDVNQNISDTGQIKIHVENTPPNYSNTTYTVSENASVNDTIGTRIMTAKPANYVITYHIDSGNVGNTFGLDSLTGTFYIANTDSLIAANYPTFTLHVRANVKSPIAYSDLAVVTINVEPFNPPPFAGFGNALEFDGVDDYINLGNDSSLTIIENGTWAGWFYFDTLTDQTLFNKYSGAYNTDGYYMNYYGNRLYFSQAGYGFRQSSTGTTEITPKVWTHIAYVKYESSVKIYVNGIDVTQQKGQHTDILEVGAPLKIGAQGGISEPFDQNFNGKMDEIAVFNRALSPGEISNLKGNVANVNPEGLISYLNFNQIDPATKVLDLIQDSLFLLNYMVGNEWEKGYDTLAFNLFDDSPLNYKVAQVPAEGLSLNSNLKFNLLTFSNIFNLSPSGSLTIKNPTLFVPNSQYKLHYEVEDLSNQKLDSGYISINIFETPEINDTSISIGQLTQNYEQILDLEARKINALSQAIFTKVSTNAPGVFEIDTNSGILTVANSDSLLFTKYPQIIEQIEVFDPLTSWRDTITVTFNVLNSGAPVYAGFGNAIKPQSGRINFDIPAPNYKGNSLAMWVNPHTNAFYSNELLFSFRYFIFTLQQSYLRLHTHPNRLFPNTFPLNEWTHLAVTYYRDDNLQGAHVNTVNHQWKIYINGNLTYEFNYGMGPQSSFLSDFASFDEISLWNKVLNNEEVRSLMNGQIDLSDTTLQFYSNGNQKDKSTLIIDNSLFNQNGTISSPNEEQFTVSKNQEIFISTKTSLTDTIGYAIGYQPNGLPINFSLINQSSSKFLLNSITGGLTIKHPDSIAGITDSTYINVDYVVTETTYNGTDTATIEVLIVPKFSIADDTINIEDRPLLGAVLHTIEIENPLPLTDYEFSFLPSSNYSFLSIDSAGKIRVENPDSLINSIFNPLLVNVEATETSTGKKDTAIITFNIIDSTANIYAGLGHFLRVNDEEVVEFPLSKLSSPNTDRTISFWLEVTGNSFEFYLDGFRVYFNTSYNLFFHYSNVLGYNNFNPDAGPKQVTIVTSTSKSKSFIYINGKIVNETNSPAYAYNSDGKNSIYSNVTYNDENYIALSELAVWDVALTDSAVERMYKLGIDRTDTNLVRYHPMNQVDENSLIVDYGPNAYHATISNKSFSNWQNIEDTLSYTLSKVDTNDVIGYVKVWEPKNDSISFTLIGPNASDFQINADNSITLNPNNNLPNDTSLVKLSYVATDLVGGATDTFSYNLTILPSSKAIDTLISMPEDTLLGTVFFEDLLMNKNPNVSYHYEILSATDPSIFSVGDTSGKFTLIDRDQINPALSPQNNYKVKITNNLGFVDTSDISVNYIDLPNKVFAGLGNSAQLIRGTHDAEVKIYRDSALINTSFTIEFLAKTNTFQYPPVNNLIRTSDNSIYAIVTENASTGKTQLNFKIAGKNGTVDLQIDSLFHHYAFVKDRENNQFKFYFDGQEIFNQPDFTSSTSTQELRLGYNQNHSGSGPRIDEFRIWLAAKSKNEINQLKFNNTNPIQPNLWLYLNFNQFNGDTYLNNLTQNQIRIDREFPEDAIFFSFDRSIKDTISQAISANDTVFFATASSLFNHSKFQFTKLPGNADFQYFDLNDTSGAITISPKADFSGITNLFELKYLATDITEANAFDTGSVLIYVAQAPTQLASTNFIIDENLPVGDTVGFRRVLNPDSNSVYRYQIIGGNSFNSFEIDSITSTITVLNNDSLDYERYSTFNLLVQAIGTDTSATPDSTTLIDTATITINLNNLVEPVFAGFADGFDLNSTNDYIEVNNIPNAPNNLTQSIWVNTTQTTTLQIPLMTKRQNALTDAWPTLGFTNNNAAFMADGSGFLVEIFGPKVNDGKWHLITGVMQGNSYTLYVDGKFAAQNFFTLNINSQSAYRIGQHSAWGRNYDGLIDEAAVWNKALTAAEIDSIYNGKYKYNDTSLLFLYDFNRVNPQPQILDASTRNNKGILVNAANNFVAGANKIVRISENIQPHDSVATIFGLDYDYSKLSFLLFNGDTSLFKVDSVSGLITIAPNTSLDYETDSIYQLTYVVNEAGDLQSDTNILNIQVIDGPDLEVIHQGPNYLWMPQKQYNGIPVTVFNNSRLNYNKAFFVNVEIESETESIKLNGLNAFADTTILFNFPTIKNTLGAKQITTHFSFESTEEFPFTDTFYTTLTITDTLLARRIFTDSASANITLGAVNSTLFALNNQKIGVEFEISSKDTLQNIQVNLNQILATDSFEFAIYNIDDNMVIPQAIEFGEIAFFDTLSGLKTITLNCFNDLDSGKYLFAFGKINGNQPTYWNTSMAVADTHHIWFFDTSWIQLNPAISGIVGAPITHFNFKRNKNYPNLIAQFTDSANCNGNRQLFFKDINFLPNITWNNTLTADTFINAQSQWIKANYLLTSAGCSFEDSVYSQISNMGLLANASDSANICEEDTIQISASAYYNQFSWSINDSVLAFTDSVFSQVFDSSGTFIFTIEAKNQNETCIQNDTITYLVRNKFVTSLNSLPSICGNDSLLSLSGFVNDTLNGSFSGQGISGFFFDATSVLPDSIYTIIYTRTTSFGCTSSDTNSIEVGGFPTFSFNNFTPEICDYDSLHLDSVFNISPINGYFNNPQVSQRVFVPDSAGLKIIKYYKSDTLINNLVCSDSALLNIQVNFTPQASLNLTFNRLCVDSANHVLNGGLPTGGVYSGNFINTIGNQSYFFPPSADTGLHTINYTHTTPEGCVSSASDTIRVDSLPFVNIAALPSICVNDDTLHLNNFGIPQGGIFSGAAVFLDSAQQYFFNPDSASTGASNFINYSYTDSITGCRNQTTYLATLNPLPSITFSPLQNFCIEDTAFEITQFSPPGGVFSGNGIFNDTITNKAYFISDSAGVGQHNITYTFTNSLGCVNSLTRQTIVNGLPTVNFTVANNIDTLCFSTQAQNFPLTTGNPAGGFYSGKNVNFNNFNLGGVLPGTDTIIYTYTHPTTGCIAHDTSFVEIFGLPQLSLNLITDSICNNATTIALSGGVPTSGNIAQTYYSGSGITNNIFNPNSLSPGIYNVRFVAIDSIGCADSVSQTITVHPVPNISYNTIAPICLLDTTQINASTSGAISWAFSITNNSLNTINTTSGLFTANQVGLDTIQFSLTDINGCSDSAIQSITIDTLPKVTLPAFADACRNGFPINFNTGIPSGGIYRYNNTVVSGSITPSTLGSGTHFFEYTYTDLNGCSASDTNTVIIHLPPNVSLQNLPDVCTDDSAFTLNQGLPKGGIYTANQGMLNDSVFDPLAVIAGAYNIHYQYTDTNGCDSSVTATLTVNPLPVVNFKNLIPSLCTNSDSVIIADSVNFPALPPLGYFTGNGVDSFGVFKPEVAWIGGHNITYHYTDANGCSNTTTTSIIVNGLPTPIILQSEVQICLGDTAIIEAQGGVQFIWETGDTTAQIRVAPDSATWYAVTITDGLNCSNNDSILQDVYNSFFIEAAFDSTSTEMNTEVTLDLLANDRGNISKYTILNGPFNGTIEEEFNPELDYTPNLGFRRVDSLIYQLCDDFCPSVCDTGMVKIKVFGNPNEFIPDGFSPNGDGQNDFWIVPGIELYPNNELIIFNRWGNTVFTAAPYNNNWNGQSGGMLSFGSDNLPDGTYFYVLKLDKDSNNEPLSGTIEMRR